LFRWRDQWLVDRATAEGLKRGSPLEVALASLAEAHVTFGIDRARLSAALETRGTPVVVAEGRAAVGGLDGSVAFAASLDVFSGRPHVSDAGNSEPVRPGRAFATAIAVCALLLGGRRKGVGFGVRIGQIQHLASHKSGSIRVGLRSAAPAASVEA
jgi:hypothetical protein